jgi:hypothetical protein
MMYPAATLAARWPELAERATLTTVSKLFVRADEAGDIKRPGSLGGMFIINPPHTLKLVLQL